MNIFTRVLFRGKQNLETVDQDGWSIGMISHITASQKFIKIQCEKRIIKASLRKNGWRTASNRWVIIEETPTSFDEGKAEWNKMQDEWKAAREKDSKRRSIQTRINGLKRQLRQLTEVHPFPEIAHRVEMNDKVFETLREQGISEEAANDTLQAMDD